jgi:hypothetical protein
MNVCVNRKANLYEADNDIFYVLFHALHRLDDSDEESALSIKIDPTLSQLYSFLQEHPYQYTEYRRMIAYLIIGIGNI